MLKYVNEFSKVSVILPLTLIWHMPQTERL